MELPIDTNVITCFCGWPGRPRVKRGSTEQMTNWDGEPVFETGVMINYEGRSEVIVVATTTRPPQMTLGQGLRVDGLSVEAWERQDGRHGVNHRAKAIEVVGRAPQKEPS